MEWGTEYWATPALQSGVPYLHAVYMECPARVRRCHLVVPQVLTECSLWDRNDSRFYKQSKGKRRRELQRMRQLDGITDSMDVNLSKFQEIVEDGGVWLATVHGVAKSWTWLSDWTTKMTQISTVPKSLVYLKIKHKLQGSIFIKHFSDYKKSKISWDMETKRQWLQYLQSWTVFWF